MMQFVVYFHVTGNFAKGVHLDALFFVSDFRTICRTIFVLF